MCIHTAVNLKYSDFTACRKYVAFYLYPLCLYIRCFEEENVKHFFLHQEVCYLGGRNKVKAFHVVEAVEVVTRLHSWLTLALKKMSILDLFFYLLSLCFWMWNETSARIMQKSAREIMYGVEKAQAIDVPSKGP